MIEFTDLVNQMLEQVETYGDIEYRLKYDLILDGSGRLAAAERAIRETAAAMVRQPQQD